MTNTRKEFRTCGFVTVVTPTVDNERHTLWFLTWPTMHGRLVRDNAWGGWNLTIWEDRPGYVPRIIVSMKREIAGRFDIIDALTERCIVLECADRDAVWLSASR